MTPVKSGSRRRGRRPLQREPDAGPGVGLHHAAGQDHPGQDHPTQDWSAIEVGSTVSVTPPAGVPYLGRVDAKTPDSGIVWVLSLEGSGRQMHGHLDGVRLLPAARWPS
jgi:hypothetical protein